MHFDNRTVTARNILRSGVSTVFYNNPSKDDFEVIKDIMNSLLDYSDPKHNPISLSEVLDLRTRILQ